MLSNSDYAFGADACPKPGLAGLIGAPAATRMRDARGLIAPVSAQVQGTGLSTAGNRPNAGIDAAWGPPIG